MPIITVSRQCGSYGDEISQLLAERLGYAHYNRDDLLNRFIRPYVTNHVFRMLQESPKFYSEIFEEGQTYYEYLYECIHRLIKSESIVFLFWLKSFFGRRRCIHFSVCVRQPSDRIVQH